MSDCGVASTVRLHVVASFDHSKPEQTLLNRMNVGIMHSRLADGFNEKNFDADCGVL
jgi:hypothetical protein